MSLFVRLPDSIAIETLVLWCDLKDLGYLDVAFCCDQRQAFLDIFKHDNFILKSEPLNRQKIISPWVKARGIKLSFLHLDDQQLKSSLHLLNTSGVVKINFDPQYMGSNTDEILLQTINSCPNLKILDINNGLSALNILKEVSKNILHQLTSLKVTSIDETDEMSSDLMAFLAENCAQIETFIPLALDCTSVDWETNLTTFVAKNKNLKLLHLSGTTLSTTIVLSLAKHAKLLEDVLIMSQYGSITLSSTAELFKQCRHLKNVFISSPMNGLIELYTHVSTDKSVLSTRGIKISDAEVEEFDWSPLTLLLENVFSLHEMYLDDMRGVPGSVLHTIAKHHKALETIKIGFIGTMYTGHDVAQIVQKCSELSCIHLSDCEHFSAQDFITAFVHNSSTNSKLLEISLINNANITNNEVNALITTNKLLQKLLICECNEIDDNELRAFIQSTKRNIHFIGGYGLDGFDEGLEGDENDGGWGDDLENMEVDEEEELNYQYQAN